MNRLHPLRYASRLVPKQEVPPESSSALTFREKKGSSVLLDGVKELKTAAKEVEELHKKRSIVLTSATATTPLLPITSTCLQCKWTNQEASNRKKQDLQLGHKIGCEHIKKNISTYKQGGLNEWSPPGGHTLQLQLDFWKCFPVTGRNELTRRRAAFQSIFLKRQQLCKVKMFCLFFIPIQSQSSPVQSAVTWFRSNKLKMKNGERKETNAVFSSAGCGSFFPSKN